MGAGTLSAPRVLGRSDLKWTDYEAGRFGARVADLARPLGAEKLGYNLQEIPPGKASVPYHAHFVNEELIALLEGEAWVRLDDREHRLVAPALVALPPGRESAHQLLNRSADPALALLASTMIPYEWVEYPDSGKRMFRLSGLPMEPPDVRKFVRDDGLVDPDPTTYFEGEPVDDPVGPPPEAGAEPDPRVVPFDAVDWEPNEWGPFRSERKRLGRAAGARLLGASLWRLQPGERNCPYHVHHVNEEAFFVLSGRAVLRTPDGEREVGPGDAMAFPPGPDGAHGFRGVGEEAVVFLALGTMEAPEIAEYPDSGKVYVMGGTAPGGDMAGRTLDLVFRRTDAVDYWEGES
ncbi:MAG TPA: cupin domain-containing protein [Gemmatimonadota bacterium]|nr:cupin domain-containing protein [Gemmatimonadota bacterium]